jgi:hypothetical protein
LSIIKANTFQDRGGNTILSSDGSGTITLGSSFPNNTPAFLAYVSSNQNLTDSTTTKVDIDTTQIDTHSAFDTGNNRFTIPSGQAGTYHLFAQANIGNANGSADNLRDHYLYIYKNGSGIAFSDHNPNSSWWAQNTSYVSMIADLSVGDYIEMYAYINVGSGDGRIVSIDGGKIKSFLYGYKLIGA